MKCIVGTQHGGPAFFSPVLAQDNLLCNARRVGGGWGIGLVTACSRGPRGRGQAQVVWSLTFIRMWSSLLQKENTKCGTHVNFSELVNHVASSHEN